MAGRKALPKEVQAMFDKYTKNHLRRLKKDVAVTMLKEEYKLSENHAVLMFDAFDIDKNGEMSIWEYQQFYWCVGENVDEILQKYNDVKLDDGSGNVDIEKTWDVMKSMKETLPDKTLEKMIMDTASEEKALDLNKFIVLVMKIKQYRG